MSFIEYVRLTLQRLFVVPSSGHHLTVPQHTGTDYRVEDGHNILTKVGKYTLFFLTMPRSSQHHFKLWLKFTFSSIIHTEIFTPLSTLTLSEIRMWINPTWRILPVCLYHCSEPSILPWWLCWTGVLSVSPTAPPSLVECKHWGGEQTSGDQWGKQPSLASRFIWKATTSYFWSPLTPFWLLSGEKDPGMLQASSESSIEDLSEASYSVL